MKPTITLLDDSTRPKAPKIEGLDAQQRAWGQRLRHIHDFHIEQLDDVRLVMEEVIAGEANPGAMPEAIAAMPMVSNYRLFGTLCGRECRMLSLHHMIEDQSMFPALRQESARAGSDGLRKVMDRLTQEHDVIHRLLDVVYKAAVAAAAEPGRETFAELKASFLVLERVVRSHFGYEQEELEEALGYFAIPL